MNAERRKKISDLMSRAARGGHLGVWRELYVVLHPFAVCFARKRLSNLEDAEDIAQEAFLRLKNVCYRYRDSADGVAFFGSILNNVVLEHLAKRGKNGSERTPFSLSGVDAASLPTVPLQKGLSDPEQEAHDVQFRQAFEEAVRRLPPAMREAVELRLIDGLKNAEASKKADCGVPTIKQRLTRALRRLRSELAAFGRSPPCML